MVNLADSAPFSFTASRGCRASFSAVCAFPSALCQFSARTPSGALVVAVIHVLHVDVLSFTYFVLVRMGALELEQGDGDF